MGGGHQQGYHGEGTSRVSVTPWVVPISLSWSIVSFRGGEDLTGARMQVFPSQTEFKHGCPALRRRPVLTSLSGLTRVCWDSVLYPYALLRGHLHATLIKLLIYEVHRMHIVEHAQLAGVLAWRS